MTASDRSDPVLGGLDDILPELEDIYKDLHAISCERGPGLLDPPGGYNSNIPGAGKGCLIGSACGPAAEFPGDLFFRCP